MTELVRIVQEATETAVRKSSVRPMRTFICIRCRQAFDHNKPGRRPWRCKECIRAVEVERIQLRNISDRIKRLDSRDPLCRDCRAALVFDDTGARRCMRVYCDPCRAERKRSQDGRRNGKLKGYGTTNTGGVSLLLPSPKAIPKNADGRRPSDRES